MPVDYQGAEEAMLDLWVGTTLAGYSDFNTISTGLTARIFNRLAPPSTVFPYIVYQVQSPPNVVRGVGPAEVMVDTLYTVKAVAQALNMESLAPVASGIRSALVSDNGESITGGLLFTCTYESGHSLVEVESGKQFRQLGGLFRIQAQAA